MGRRLENVWNTAVNYETKNVVSIEITSIIVNKNGIIVRSALVEETVIILEIIRRPWRIWKNVIVEIYVSAKIDEFRYDISLAISSRPLITASAWRYKIKLCVRKR